jgi:hypothetical protein
MKMLLLIAMLLVSTLAIAQTNQIPELPDVPSSEDSPWTDSQCFWAGLTLGFIYGGVAFSLRLARQAGEKNPGI